MWTPVLDPEWRHMTYFQPSVILRGGKKVKKPPARCFKQRSQMLVWLLLCMRSFGRTEPVWSNVTRWLVDDVSLSVAGGNRLTAVSEGIDDDDDVDDAFRGALGVLWPSSQTKLSYPHLRLFFFAFGGGVVAKRPPPLKNHIHICRPTSLCICI